MKRYIKPILILGFLFTVLVFCIWGLGSALFPLFISMGLSYLLFPLIKKLEKKGIKREYAVVCVFLIIALILALVTALVVPSLVRDTQDFVKELPRNSSKAIEKVEKFAIQMGYPVNLSKDSVGNFIKEQVSSLSGSVAKNITETLKSSFAGITKWLVAILNFFLIPLFFFYVINDYEKIINEMKSFIPKPFLFKFNDYIKLSDNVLSGYIRGQLLVAFVLGVLYAAGLSLVGLKFGALIGLMSGFLNIIPYVGFVLGFSVAILIALSNYTGVNLLIGVSAVFIVIQAIEGSYITPKLVGDKVGLSALTTMLALIIGGNLLGLTGMLLAIPTAAILKSILKEVKREYQKLDLYTE